jgi:hypothetical protein
VTITVNLPDGSKANFPDGTPPDVMQKALARFKTPAQPMDPSTRAAAQDFIANPTLPSPSVSPQEQARRTQSGPADPAQRAADLRAGSHDAPPYQKTGQTLPGGRQILYDMATNDVERFKILSKYYGQNNVGRDEYGLYVRQPGGKQIYPKSSLVSGAVSGAAPVVGGTLGAVAASEGGPVGAVAGSGAGAAAGQGVNDAVLGIMGFYDRTMGSEVGNLASTAASNAALEGAGRGLGAAARLAGTTAKDAALSPVRKALGFDAAAAARAKELVEHGYSVNPMSYVQDAKRIGRQIELSRLYGGDYTAKSEEKFARDKAIAALKKAGMSDADAAAEYERMKTPAAVTAQPAGQALKGAAAAETSAARGGVDQAKQATLAGAEAGGKAAVAARDASVRDLTTRLRSMETTLQKNLDQGKRTLDQLATQVKKGPLAEDYAKKIVDYRNQIQQDATELYGYADELAGDARINAAPAKEAALQFMQNLPEDLRAQFPALVKRIGNIAGEEGEVAEMTFGETHYLRSQLRDLAYSDKLSPEFKKGPYKHLQNVVDDMLHNSHSFAYGDADPRLKAAAAELDFADKFYARNMKQFNNATMENLVKQTKDGLPPDPVKIARMVAQTGEMATLDRLLRVGGPELRKRVAAADLQDVLAQSRKLGSQNIDPKELLKSLEERQANRTLTRLYGPQSQQLMLYARRLAAKSGAIPPAAFNPKGIIETDGFMRTLAAANKVQDRITELTKLKPMEIMEAAMKPARERVALLEKEFGGKLSADMMKFLRDPELLAEAAAHRVLGSEDLLEEAARRFPQAMPTLQKYALERVLAPLARGDGSRTLLTTLGQLTEKQQAILFPAGMAADLKRLADGLALIRGPSTRSMPGFAAGNVLGAEPVGLEGLTPAGKRQFIAEGIAKLVTSPGFNRALIGILSRDVASGPAGVAKAMTKIQALLSFAQRGAMRAGFPAQTTGTPEGQAMLPPQDARASGGSSWREQLR